LLALQTIVARNLDPTKCGVVSVTALNGGQAGSAIPQMAEMIGTARSYEPKIRDLLQRRVTEIAENVAKAYGATATVRYKRMYPPTVNHTRQTEFAVSVARSIVGDGNVDSQHTPVMGSEDFAFMLEERPGNIMLIGNGDSANVHHPSFDFNDAAIPFGVAYFVGLVESGMPR
jgi:amidohydrolase